MVVRVDRPDESFESTAFRTLFEVTPDLLCMTDVHGRVVKANPACIDILGYDPHDLTGTRVWDLAHPDDVAPAVQAMRGLEPGGTVRGFSTRIKGKDGSYRWIEWRAASPDGETIYAAGRDVTERTAAEAALRQSEAKFAAAFRTSPDSVNINRMSDGLFLEINAGFTALTGYTEQDVAGKSSLEIAVWADPADRARLIEGLRARGEFRDLEAMFRRKDGSIVSGLMSASVMEVAGETCIVSITRDISERKRAEEAILALNADLERRVQERTEELEAANQELVTTNEELSRANEELAEANVRLDEATRAKSEFLASMSHELRTPLNSILGFSGTLLGGLAGPLEPEQRKQITMINNSGGHLLVLINGVLDLAKIEAGQAEPVFEEVDCCALIEEVRDKISPLAEAKGLELRYACASRGPFIRTDRTKVEQILINLAGNAVKFTDEGRVTIAVTATDDEATFVVEDTGRGVASEDADVIFEEFYQVSAPDGGKTTGTGLGLAVSRRLAAVLGGVVELTSSSDAGSTFTLRLPLGAPDRS
jgi:PAS domain S-box-containing protein